MSSAGKVRTCHQLCNLTFYLKEATLTVDMEAQFSVTPGPRSSKTTFSAGNCLKSSPYWIINMFIETLLSYEHWGLERKKIE